MSLICKIVCSVSSQASHTNHDGNIPMTTDSTGFFSDPKVIISLIALAISLASVIFTLANQWEQNRRWDTLNLGLVQIIDQKFIMFKELSNEEVSVIDWGYNPTLYKVVKDNVHQNRVTMPYELVLMDSNNVRIPNSNGTHTLSGALKEIERLNLQVKPNIFKHYQIKFDVKNTGSTTAKEVNIKMMTHILGDDKAKIILDPTVPIDLYPSRETSAIADLFIPINDDLPLFRNFSAVITYKDVNNKQNTTEWKMIYDREQNYWTYSK